MDAKTAKKALKELKDDDRDLYFYSGEITPSAVNSAFFVLLQAKTERKREKASLVLTTPGGDAHHAYRLARIFQDLYQENFRIVVEGPCKSAGTLVAIGASELAMSLFGELGPLDVQISKTDEIGPRTSGLDTLGALGVLETDTFNAFEKFMVAIVNRSGFAVSTKTACEISVQLVTGLFAPIASQINPHRLSEVDRMMDIAREYARRLGIPNLKDTDALERLLNGYPTHGFIIDRKEAQEIFTTVLSPTDAETMVVPLFGKLVLNPFHEEGAQLHDVVGKLEHIAGPEESDTRKKKGLGQVSGGEGDSKGQRKKNASASRKGAAVNDSQEGA